MVKVVNDNGDAPVTARYFMSSINSWYNKEGIKCGVERVSKLFQSQADKQKASVSATFSILSDMPKCRARVIDEESGLAVKIEDETTGEQKDKIEIISDPSEVTFFFNVRWANREANEFKVNPQASCFPLFNFAFQATGDLPKGNTNGFIANIDELKEALLGLEFIARVKEESFQGRKYFVIIPSETEDIWE